MDKEEILLKKKKVLYSEFAYVLGIFFLALGAALMEKADFGMSVVVAPAYLLYLKISQYIPAFTFGMAEYSFQAVILIIMTIVLKRGRISYLFSFVTAVIYGIILDACMFAVRNMVMESISERLISYVCGFLLCALGVSLFFHTYISPEAYELLVKEISAKYDFPIARVKVVYDCCSCFFAIILSFLFFGLWHFEGVKTGTIICALFNGWNIGFMSRILESIFELKDMWPLRKYFENINKD